MAALRSQGKAFNRTRQNYLATELAVADTHWTRLRGLLGLGIDDFRNGSGLWIVPCKGVHTLGMSFAIDVIYLDPAMKVIDLLSAVKPWRVSPIRRQATSVLELPCHTAVQTKTQIGDTIDVTLSKDCTQLL
ncbi:MAG TPA: DUF192 domain-containing protein [Candidatus Sulfotelmatobacter sp.]|nr:DUF192 domain-containing protein [Candidatus Sulfotelmatobacter sp.]